MEIKINSILEDSEKIIWQGIINRKVLSFILIISLLIVFLISGYFFIQKIIHYTSNGNPAEISGWIIGLIILVIGPFLSLWSYFSAIVTDYAVTNKRIIIKSGIIGTDFKSIYYNEIKNIIVDVGLIGKIFSVGTIKIDIGKIDVYSSGINRDKAGNYSGGEVKTKTMYDELKYIDSPYEVYKYVQSTLSGRVESLYSGRADREPNLND